MSALLCETDGLTKQPLRLKSDGCVPLTPRTLEQTVPNRVGNVRCIHTMASMYGVMTVRTRQISA